MDKLYTVQEVAEILKFKQRHIYTMLRNGILPFIRIGVGRGVVRIKQSDLEEYMTRGNKKEEKGDL